MARRRGHGERGRVTATGHPTAEQAAGPPASPDLAWWQRPIVWITTVVLGALATIIAAYGEDIARGFLDARAEPTALGERWGAPAPIRIVNVRRVTYDTGDFVFPDGLSDTALAALDRSETGLTDAWLEANGGVEVGRASWEIALEGLRTRAVEITNLRTVAARPCDRPVGGTLLENPGAGQSDKIPLDVEVDRPGASFHAPAAEDDNGSPLPTEPYFRKHKITLPKGETNILVVSAFTARQHCRWTVVAEYIADGRTGEMTITAPGGKPFAVTGRVPAQTYHSAILSPLRQCAGLRHLRVSADRYARVVKNQDCPD